MKILGIQKTTLLDFPGHVAATIFVGGCNFRCPFCHNGDLVLSPGELSPFSEEEILAFLKKRQGILDGVCITGGEPTLQPDLELFIRKIKSLDYQVKLDTNGYRPEVLQSLLEQGLLDYVAMDIKASRENYSLATGLSPRTMDIERIEKSVCLLMESKIDYEFRTTVVKGIHTIRDFEQIGEWLRDCRAYYLQSYTENENIIAFRQAGVIPDRGVDCGPNQGSDRGPDQMEAFTPEELERFRVKLCEYISNVVIRGVE